MVRNAGIGLFAACELPNRTLIGYYCGVLLWCSGQMLQYDENSVIEPPDEKTDAYTILMRDSKGEWVHFSVVTMRLYIWDKAKKDEVFDTIPTRNG